MPPACWHFVFFLSRKKTIQDKFKIIIGLKVDYVRPGGEGTFDDGFFFFFNDSLRAAEVTEIKESPIIRFATILKTMPYGYELNEKNIQ